MKIVFYVLGVLTLLNVIVVSFGGEVTTILQQLYIGLQSIIATLLIGFGAVLGAITQIQKDTKDED